MSKVYISGGITDVPDYRDRFLKAETRLISQGFTVVNPSRLNLIMPEDSTWDEYMIVALDLLRMCDMIFMLPGWEKSAGARIEHDIAVKRNMQIIWVLEE